MSDLLILGGGVIGLSLAYELAGHGIRARVVDRGHIGGETSWAAAGIFPAAKFRSKAPPVEWLAGYSAQVYPEWSARLRNETGIDNGYRQCGGIHLAQTDEGTAELLRECDTWRREGLAVKWLHAADLDAAEPALAGAYDRHGLTGGVLLAEETQLRPPRHMAALEAACVKRGVELSPGIEVYDFELAADRIRGIVTNRGTIAAEKIVLASGAWSAQLAARLNLKLSIKPIRGQIALLNGPPGLLRQIIHVNNSQHYLVPRDDGRVLVGTTLEDVGFDRRTTAAALADMLSFATNIAPALAAANLECTWTGFRPGTADGLPYLGQVPGLANAYLATGHYRSGLYWAPATAVIMSRLLRGEPAGIDLTPFGVVR